ncbi:MAG TPA: hypothetical protein VIG79_09575 [Lapillicoccus sp.]|uniref:hypothetical protein n=1 Tax=Lapillicoccus sp. TaxID=1909287 RepID=UPI002F944D4D
MDGHQDPVVVVLALLDELLTEPVLPNPDEDELSEDEFEDEFEDVEAVEAVEVDVPAPLVVATATVADRFAAYASARWRPRPPAVSVVASRTPAVHRRVVDRARSERRLVMSGTPCRAHPARSCEPVVVPR